MLQLTNSIADLHKTDWQNLLPDLLAATAKKLTSIWDYISFRGVCKSWRSAANFDNFDRSIPQVPFLVFAERRSRSRVRPSSYVTKFLDLSENKTFRIAHFQEEEEKEATKYLSCSGWILGVAESSVHIHLTHPIRRVRVQLPDLDTFPGFINNLSRLCGLYFMPFISKMVFSSSSSSDFVVMVIWGEKNQLGFSRPGDSSWTVMELWDKSFVDILYHKGKLYAIDDCQRVVECDIHGHNPTRIHQISGLQRFDHVRSNDNVHGQCHCYMVESSGKFLVVSVCCFNRDFRVYEFDLTDDSHKEIFHLGNKALFLSPNSSFCLEDFVWNDKVEPNCIYFTEWGLCFRLDNKIYPKYFFDRFSPRVISPPTWVVPDFDFR